MLLLRLLLRGFCEVGVRLSLVSGRALVVDGSFVVGLSALNR